MTDNSVSRGLTRRSFLTGAGAAAGVALGGRLLTTSTVMAAPGRTEAASAAATHPVKQVHLVGTDGWVGMPAAPPDPPFFPDPLAPAPFNTYVFGFRDVTGMTSNLVAAQRGKAQISAPMMAFDEEDDVYLTLTNLGLRSGRTSSTATPCTGTVSSTRSRCSTACRSSHSRCRSAGT